MRQIVLEISHSKVRNLSKIKVAILKVFQPHFHINMTSQMQSYKKTIKIKMKVQYLRILLFDLFEILCNLAKEYRLILNFLAFGIHNKNNKPLFKNKRLLFSHNKKSVSSIFLQKMMLCAVIIQLCCFRIFLKNTFV